MSYDTQEQSVASSQAFELFQFSTVSATYFLTSADQPIVYVGQTYAPTTLERTEFEYSNEVTTGQLKIKLPLSHAVSQSLVPYLTPSPMRVQVFGGHYGDTDVVRLFIGYVSTAVFDEMCEMTVNSDAYLLQRKIPKQVYQSPCDHVFGDSGCKMNLPSLTSTALVGTVSADGLTVTATAFSSVAFGLAGGYLRFGNEYRMIQSHSGATITLLSAISGLAAGATVTVCPGCQLTYAACQAYNNVANFLGFDLIPLVNPFTQSLT